MSIEGNEFKAIGEFMALYYERLGRKIHVFVDKLTDEQLWSKPYPYGNSLGHLVLHLTGNLNYYIGAQIAETGYVREREREFTEEAPPSRGELIERFDDVIAMVAETIRSLEPEEWMAPYTAVGEEYAESRYGIIIHCVSHFNHHIGQMIYLCEAWENPSEKDR